MENESPRAPRKENFNYRLADRFGLLLWVLLLQHHDDESLHSPLPSDPGQPKLIVSMLRAHEIYGKQRESENHRQHDFISQVLYVDSFVRVPFRHYIVRYLDKVTTLSYFLLIFFEIKYITVNFFL